MHFFRGVSSSFSFFLLLHGKKPFKSLSDFICMHAKFLRECCLNSVLNHVNTQSGDRRNMQSRLSDYRNIPHIDVHFLVVMMIVDMMENNITKLTLESRGIYRGNVLMRWLKTVFVYLVYSMYVKLINKPVVFVCFI